MRGFMIYLNSLSNVKSDILLSFTEGGFELGDWWPSVTLAYGREFKEFSVAGCWWLCSRLTFGFGGVGCWF